MKKLLLFIFVVLVGICFGKVHGFEYDHYLETVGKYGDYLESCELIKHYGDSFTYNDSASQRYWGQHKTIEKFTGCELQCSVVIKTGGHWRGVLSLPVNPLDFAKELQDELEHTGRAQIKNVGQIYGRIAIGHDALMFIPNKSEEFKSER